MADGPINKENKHIRRPGGRSTNSNYVHHTQATAPARSKTVCCNKTKGSQHGLVPVGPTSAQKHIACHDLGDTVGGDHHRIERPPCCLALRRGDCPKTDVLSGPTGCDTTPCTDPSTLSTECSCKPSQFSECSGVWAGRCWTTCKRKTRRCSSSSKLQLKDARTCRTSQTMKLAH